MLSTLTLPDSGGYVELIISVSQKGVWKCHKADGYCPFSQSCYKIILYYDLQKNFEKNK